MELSRSEWIHISKTALGNITHKFQGGMNVVRSCQEGFLGISGVPS